MIEGGERTVEPAQQRPQALGAVPACGAARWPAPGPEPTSAAAPCAGRPDCAGSNAPMPPVYRRHEPRQAEARRRAARCSSAWFCRSSTPWIFGGVRDLQDESLAVGRGDQEVQIALAGQRGRGGIEAVQSRAIRAASCEAKRGRTNVTSTMVIPVRRRGRGTWGYGTNTTFRPPSAAAKALAMVVQRRHPFDERRRPHRPGRQQIEGRQERAAPRSDDRDLVDDDRPGRHRPTGRGAVVFSTTVPQRADALERLLQAVCPSPVSSTTTSKRSARRQRRRPAWAARRGPARAARRQPRARAGRRAPPAAPVVREHLRDQQAHPCRRPGRQPRRLGPSSTCSRIRQRGGDGLREDGGAVVDGVRDTGCRLDGRQRQVLGERSRRGR